MIETFLNGRVVLHGGDNRDVLRGIADSSIDSIVTDPPYALVSIVKRFGGANPGNEDYALNKSKSAYMSRGFMGKQWDNGETAFAIEFWAECLRVLKPGGHVVSFSGTRTYHRMVVAIEDAGFEVRDQIGWTFGSGFPKSHNAGNGWGTALKPAWEPICLARKPLEGTVAANVLAHGTGAINVDGCRVGTDETITNHSRGSAAAISKGIYGDSAAQITHQTMGQLAGRWPANIVHDGSDEVLAAFPETESGSRKAGDYGVLGGDIYSRAAVGPMPSLEGSSGSAARFFYTAKADSDDRLGSKHPTVKPVDLMQWLCRLVTPKNGTILDPFAGTGTTGEAAFREGFNAVLIEREEEYQADIRRRMSLCLSGPEERKRVATIAKTGDAAFGADSMFAAFETTEAAE